MNHRKLTSEQLKDLLSYNQKTGEFVWLVGRLRGKVAGKTNNNGYRHIRIQGVDFQAHRLAWLYVHGEWPEGWLDHKDRTRSNNAIANLRPATPSQNSANSKVSVLNTSGFKGVSWNKPRELWIAWIRSDGLNRYLGGYPTKEEAAAAYQAASRLIFGEFRPSKA